MNTPLKHYLVTQIKKMNTLITQKNNTPVVSHITIWEKTWNESRAVKQLIEKYSENLETLWGVTFEMTPLKTNWWVQNVKQYFLNEDQATFLMTLLKNTKEVVDFKLNLVTEFKKLRQERKPLTYEEVMDNALQLAAGKVKELQEENKGLVMTIQEQAPKVKFAEAIGDTEEGILVWDFAKTISKELWISMWQNKLFAWLRDNKILMKKNWYHMPYQTHLKYFNVVERKKMWYEWERLFFTCYINWAGQTYIFNKLNKEFNDNND